MTENRPGKGYEILGKDGRVHGLVRSKDCKALLKIIVELTKVVPQALTSPTKIHISNFKKVLRELIKYLKNPILCGSEELSFKLYWN